MKYLRLASASVLLMVAATGCHRKQPQALPPPQAQAPTITPKPAPATVPPSTQPVLQAAPPGTSASPPPSTPATPPETKSTQVHHHPFARKKQTTPASSTDANSDAETASKESSAPAKRASNPPAGSARAAIGQLSAADATSSPDHGRETRNLINATQERLGDLTDAQKSQHQASLLQVASFLDQAKQALSTNDLDGAQTLANKAKILLDELLK